MYTQCPECDVAFRVTAEVLKMAAGKVRCGGCGVAFNALNHLSEEMPAAGEPETPKPKIAELTLEEPGKLEADTPPKTISAEQSAALLKTLDQLAGDDIRIEDTGVEWRVLDADEDDEDDGLEEDPTPSLVAEEMRFDDNTPLPDDFDLDAQPTAAPAPVVEVIEPARSLEDSQVDLAFGEPDEWEDLLDDLEELDEELAEVESEQETAEAGDISAEIEALPDIEEIETAAAVEEPLDMDTQFAIQAEAMGIDLSGIHDTEDEIEPEEAIADVDDAADEEPHETSIDEDLIAAAFESEAAAKTELDIGGVAPEDLSRAGILDEDDYLEEIVAEPEVELEEEEKPELEKEAADEEVAEVEEELEAEAEEEPDDASQGSSEEELEEELELAFERFTEEEGLGDDFVKFAEPDTPEVPEPTDEEKTQNLMIDQDLLAIAVEDDDGFTSTIVQKQLGSEDDIPAGTEKKADLPEEDVVEDEAPIEAAKQAKASPLVETIIMEGDVVHADGDRERLAAQRKAASASLSKSGFDKDKKSRRDRNWSVPSFGMMAATFLLFVVLVLQVIHQSREALATSATFEKTIGPVYRMVGSPVTPGWDIKGWRFEATKGSTDEEDQMLTIYSRVGNTSDQALPYPLVHVSLTDRFEEIIGSRVLEPSEYLVDNADPRRPIQPKNTFNAVISIESPSEEATGFKLHVCYRLSSGQLRCAIQDFK